MFVFHVAGGVSRHQHCDPGGSRCGARQVSGSIGNDGGQDSLIDNDRFSSLCVLHQQRTSLQTLDPCHEQPRVFSVLSQSSRGSGQKKSERGKLGGGESSFLEMYVFKAPQQDRHDLERCNTFSRDHFILGTFNRALTLLEKYPVTAFHSLHLPAYVLTGLSKNAALMESTMCEGQCSQDHGHRINLLKEKFGLLF